MGALFGLDNGLSWEDWFYLAQNRVAIRHHHDKNKADTEQINGCTSGDACSLVIPFLDDALALTNLEQLFGTLPNKNGIFDTPILDEMINRSMQWRKRIYHADTGYRLEIQLKNLKKSTQDKSLDKCKESIKNIYNILLFDWVSYCIDIIKAEDKGRSFLFIQSHAKPFDFENYPLGKLGSSPFSSSDVLMQVFHIDKDWSAEYAFVTIVKAITLLRKGQLKAASPIAVSPQDLQVADPLAFSWKPIIGGAAIGLTVLGLFALIDKLNAKNNITASIKPTIINLDVAKLDM